MAEAIVSFAVQKLGDFLIQEAVSLTEVKDELEWLKRKLTLMLAFLNDAEEKQDGNHRINQWLSDITDAAYEAEDIIDKLIIKQEEDEGLLRKVSLNTFLGREINALKIKLNEIHRNQEVFKIGNIGDAGEGSRSMNERLKLLRTESPYEDDDEDVVGFKEDAESLMKEVLKDERHRRVVAIVGMGGLGKTTLARKLYNEGSSRETFSCRAWVSVSEEYNIQDLLGRIIISFEIPTTKEEWKMLDRSGLEGLKGYLRKYLDGKRYLVVIDDVWEVEAWASLRRAFPDNKNGSRVIITTRNKAVAERCGERRHVYELPFLKYEETWELFCKKAFLNYDGASHNNCPPSLEGLARDMVSKCGGLPLAIVVLGGILSTKDPDEWPKLQEHVSWQVIRDGWTHVEELLSLSFNDLPHHLKPCFLYLGLFPENFEIEVDKLVRLWVAEGFIKQPRPEKALELEDVAMGYLKELIDRNLIQIAQKNWRRIVTCRIHDLLRHFAIEKSKDRSFLHILYAGNDIGSTNTSRGRRIASQENFGRFVSFEHSNELQLRTFFMLFDSVDTSQLEFLIKKLSLLRVLDLEFDPSSAADDIGKLIHLRYLRLEGLEMIPPSIGRLKALKTLYVAYFRKVCLPDEICHAKELRHLIGYFKWPFKLEYLTNLRTLDYVAVDGDDEMEFDPVNLVHLRELHVVFKGSNKIYCLESIGQLKSLRTLYLYVQQSNSSYATLAPLSNCQHLVQLKLWGLKGKLPIDFHQFLPNLKYLLLGGEYISENPMSALEKLLNLTILDLISYKGDELDCTASGFPQLEILRLIYCDHLQELRVEEGGMPVLRGLEVPSNVRLSDRLSSIPTPRNWNVLFFGKMWPYL